MAKDNRPLRLSDIARPDLGEGAANPFGERNDPQPAAKFAAGETYRADDFEETVGHRGRFLLLIGLVAICSSLGILGIAYFEPELREILLFYQPVVALLFGLPAWLLARSDLRAMKLGVMDRGGQGRTRIAMVCGIIATASVVALILWLAFTLFGARLGLRF